MMRQLRQMRRARGLVLGVLLTALCPALPVHAQSLDAIFRAGNAAYFKGDFASAAKQYEQLVDAGVDDPDVYFNLALAYARQLQLGRAIWSFERAQHVGSADAEASSGEAMARSALGKKRAQEQGEATIEAKPPLREALVAPFRQDVLAWLTLGFDICFFGALFMRRRVQSETLRTALAIVAAVGALALLLSAAGLSIKRGLFDDGVPAVVLREGAELREGPDLHARLRSGAHEGASARALRSDGGFVRVRVAGGAEGWMQRSDVGLVESPARKPL